MSIQRFRVPDDVRLPSHPDGEVVSYYDHVRVLRDARLVTEKQAQQARAWKALAESRGAKAEQLRQKLARYHHVVRELLHMRESEYRRGTLGWQVFVEGDARMQAARQILEEERDADTTRT